MSGGAHMGSVCVFKTHHLLDLLMSHQSENSPEFLNLRVFLGTHCHWPHAGLISPSLHASYLQFKAWALLFLLQPSCLPHVHHCCHVVPSIMDFNPLELWAKNKLFYKSPWKTYHNNREAADTALRTGWLFELQSFPWHHPLPPGSQSPEWVSYGSQGPPSTAHITPLLLLEDHPFIFLSPPFNFTVY